MFNWLTDRTMNRVAEDFFGRDVRIVRVHLFYELSRRYIAKEKDVKKAKTHAAKVVNYLLNAEGDIRQISGLAEHEMKEDQDLRELVVYTQRMLLVLGQWLYEKKNEDFMDSEQHRRIQELLGKYGGEFPDQVSPEKYTELAYKAMNKYKVTPLPKRMMRIERRFIMKILGIISLLLTLFILVVAVSASDYAAGLLVVPVTYITLTLVKGRKNKVSFASVDVPRPTLKI